MLCSTNRQTSWPFSRLSANQETLSFPLVRLLFDDESLSPRSATGIGTEYQSYPSVADLWPTPGVFTGSTALSGMCGRAASTVR